MNVFASIAFGFDGGMRDLIVLILGHSQAQKGLEYWGQGLEYWGMAKWGANSQQAHDVVLTSMRRKDVASTSFRRHVPTMF